jgi:hypothetical protein
VGRYAKAIVGALVAGLSSLQAAMDDGLTGQEGIGAAIAALLALGVVRAVPNSPTVTTSIVDRPDQPPTTITSRTE